jgi:hypothetical protein
MSLPHGTETLISFQNTHASLFVIVYESVPVQRNSTTVDIRKWPLRRPPEKPGQAFGRRIVEVKS